MSVPLMSMAMLRATVKNVSAQGQSTGNSNQINITHDSSNMAASPDPLLSCKSAAKMVEATAVRERVTQRRPGPVRLLINSLARLGGQLSSHGRATFHGEMGYNIMEDPINRISQWLCSK